MTDFKTNLKNLQSSLANDSARTKDDNGYLFVENNNISKADVNPYYGSDIPNYQSLGLIPDRIYHLYRDPLELAKAVDSFKGKPLLRGHHNIHAGDIPRDMVIGSIGTDVRFEHPFLVASLSIWDEKDIAMVEADKVKELSSSYFYTPDMTAGEVNGVRYDGVMREIVGNHVAIVEQGRAGSQVAVADSKLKTKGTVMSKVKTFMDFLRPYLARDAKDEDIEEALKKADDKAKDKAKDDEDEDDKDARYDDRIEAWKKKIANAESELDDYKEKRRGAEDGCGGRAKDEDDEDAEDKARDRAKDKARDKSEDENDDDKDARYDDEIEKLKKRYDDIRSEIDDYKEEERGAKDKSKDNAKDKARDTTKDDDEKRKADDAAMIEQRVMARLKSVEQAKNAVRPFVGNLAMDNADDIYAVGLKRLGMNLNGLPKSGYKAMFEAMAKIENNKRANDSAFTEQSSLADMMKLKRL